MKKLILTLSLFSINVLIFGQVSGNINYNNAVHIPQNYLNSNNPDPNQILIQVKGLANVKADAYLAIFGVTQVGKDQQEANKLIDERISEALNEIKLKKGVEIYVDMISFVPTYEFEVERKIFSKKTYNEVPTGFEIKKNIHLKFSDPTLLNEMVQTLAQNEIYDLIRVDYYASDLENIKKELANKAKILVQEKMKNFESILGETFINDEKTFNEEYKVVLPVEMYQSYQTSNSSTLNLRKSAIINPQQKNTTIFYQPVFSKEFDFILNPIIIEPVIQVMYDFKLLIIKNPKQDKEYLIITPNGEVKNLNLTK